MVRVRVTEAAEYTPVLDHSYEVSYCDTEEGTFSLYENILAGEYPRFSVVMIAVVECDSEGEGGGPVRLSLEVLKSVGFGVGLVLRFCWVALGA